jgi:predicted 2-oxoglutarate/Fe(II)-dependent dioxygenase YbiX
MHVDDCEGGAMRFPYAGVTIPAERGDVLCFPANYLGAHEVTPVKEGSRRISYLGWFGQGSMEPMRSPLGEFDAELVEIYDPVEQPHANFHWQTTVEEDFVRSSGWTEEEMRIGYPSFFDQRPALYWPK